jgi:hypothetical protein
MDEQTVLVGFVLWLLMLRSMGVRTDALWNEEFEELGFEKPEGEREYLSSEELAVWAEGLISDKRINECGAPLGSGSLYSLREVNEILSSKSPLWRSIGDPLYREGVISIVRDTLNRHYSDEANDGMLLEEDIVQLRSDAFKRIWPL